MSEISGVLAREVLDSRGRPTVEVEITAGAFRGRAIAPSGASTGAAEAWELRDGGERYDGLGVRQAVDNVNQVISPALVGSDPAKQASVDQILLDLDGTPQKKRLGGNAMLAVSLAASHAAAAMAGVPLHTHFHRLMDEVDESDLQPAMPTPMTNMISGGLHAGGNLDFQDVLAIPVRRVDYPLLLEWLVKIYNRLGRLLQDAGMEGRLVGDEGGFGPRLGGNREAVEFVVRAIEAAGLTPGDDVAIALDVAATHFFADGRYQLRAEEVSLSSSEMVDRLEAWTNDLPIVSIEDGLAEEDWEGWTELTERLGDRVRLVGDDLFTTNTERIQRGIDAGAGNSVLVKMNQIGTISETLAAIALARRADMSFVVSARSGETEDASIADLAVGVAAPEIKIGSIVRSERLAKYNQLLRLAEQL